MPIARTWLLALALLAGRGEAQSCRPELQGVAHNLAKGRPACQSSTLSNPIVGTASKAVDGNCSGEWFKDGSCTHTGWDMEPWWYVDLGGQYAISAVVVKNREDCCGERLQGAQVHVGDSVADHGKSSPLCGTITNTSLGSITMLSCNWLKGRYVSINIPGREEYLHVCEVEVYGAKAEDQCQQSTVQAGRRELGGKQG
ncbi:fucolectin-like isoform X2 [Rhineura floridana]|nr:fucolectin-like isoform X2 [Rhineura floridana]XP_061463144.1 fucolectin-like isoform X2 [Rhineura floridana]XP_061463145.1 fucolectin-like isoform X2 [Rhineura floridana]XP_061463146.1 fucolectin-like isoform X2 [Rhineura floridana]